MVLSTQLRQKFNTGRQWHLRYGPTVHKGHRVDSYLSGAVLRFIWVDTDMCNTVLWSIWFIDSTVTCQVRFYGPYGSLSWEWHQVRSSSPLAAETPGGGGGGIETGITRGTGSGSGKSVTITIYQRCRRHIVRVTAATCSSNHHSLSESNEIETVYIMVDRLPQMITEN